jgi:hypothetical protein
MMRASGIFLACALLASCAVESVRKIRVEIPDYTEFNLGNYREIVVTDFHVEKGSKDFDLNREWIDYIAFELGRAVKCEVDKQALDWNKEDLPENQAFWKTLKTKASPALFLTGNIRYSQEIRKALIDIEKKEVDGPFKQEKKGLTERQIYTLSAEIFLIKAETGEILFRKTYKETRIFPNPNQPFSFAFYELVSLVKQKFFHTILGEENNQDRYLIMR